MGSAPINFAQVYAALARTIQQTLGLPSNQVVKLQMTSPPASRPKLPFVAFQLTGLGSTFGKDSLAATDAPDGWVYFGPRQLTATFQFYAETHEQAFSLCSQWHASLDQEPTQDMLMAQGGISVWRRESPTDLSAMLYTGYEGRAALNCAFGVQGLSTVNMSDVAQVPISGRVDGADGERVFTVTLPTED